MTNHKFTSICMACVEKLRSLSPIDTGNLKYNAIRYEFVDKDTCKIYVDESIAPYMVYTNEPWISPKWNGKKNPNEKWFDKAVNSLVETIKMELGSHVKRIENDNH